jgi:hypothetical protein
LLKNHESHLTSSTPFPEVNGTSFDNYRGNNGRGYERGRNQGGRTQNIPRKNTTPYHRKWNYNETNNMEMEKVSRINPQKPMKKNVIGVV